MNPSKHTHAFPLRPARPSKAHHQPARRPWILAAGIMLGSLLPAHAAIQIISYDAGVAAAAGVGGAANPASQGWTYTGASGLGAHAYAADGGIRTVDASTAAGSFSQFSQILSADNLQTLVDEGGWRLTTTFQLDSGWRPDPAFGNAGSPGYYLPPNQARQNNAAMFVDIAGSYRYWLSFQADSNGNLLVFDQLTNHQITTNGGNEGYDQFFTMELLYNATTNSAVMSIGGNDFEVGQAATGAAVTLNRVVFGSTASTTMGSAVWNEVGLTAVPEPSSALLAGIGLLLLAKRRRS